MLTTLSINKINNMLLAQHMIRYDAEEKIFSVMPFVGINSLNRHFFQCSM